MYVRPNFVEDGKNNRSRFPFPGAHTRTYMQCALCSAQFGKYFCELATVTTSASVGATAVLCIRDDERIACSWSRTFKCLKLDKYDETDCVRCALCVCMCVWRDARANE